MLSKKKAKKFVLKLLFFFGICFVIFIFVNQFLKIKDKHQQQHLLEEKIASQKDKNNQLRQKLETDDSQSGVKSERRVFENVTE